MLASALPVRTCCSQLSQQWEDSRQDSAHSCDSDCVNPSGFPPSGVPAEDGLNSPCTALYPRASVNGHMGSFISYGCRTEGAPLWFGNGGVQVEAPPLGDTVYWCFLVASSADAPKSQLFSGCSIFVLVTRGSTLAAASELSVLALYGGCVLANHRVHLGPPCFC